jgi:hypothetical protein
MTCLVLLVAAGTASAKVGPIPVVATPEGVWTGTSTGELVRLDATSGRVLARTVSLGFPYALSGARGRLWAIDGRGNRVVRISASGSIVASGPLPGFPSALAVGDTSVWAVVYEGRSTGTVLLRLDPDSLRIRGRFHLGERAAQLGVAGGRVWLALDPVSPRGAAGLVAIDERHGELLFRRHLRGNVRGVSVSNQQTWVLMERRRGSRLVGVDARTGTRTRSVTGPANAGWLASGHGRVWVATLCGGPNCRIDRADIRGYDDEGRLVAGPFLPWNACHRGLANSSQLFLTGIAATPQGVAATTSDGRGRVRVALISEHGGVRRCPPV